MHIHLRVRHWVVWWFFVGVVCGVVALVNILGRNLSPAQINVVLIIGVLFWLLGGLACYGYDGVKLDLPSEHSRINAEPRALGQLEWHFASEFVIPGNRKSVLPSKY